MLEKFIEIKNVGKFTDYKASGDITLKKINLLCAENGRGKTTLCDILRSLKTGEPGYVIGRKTLGASSSQRIDIRFANGNIIFNGESWNNSYKNIEIYDATFIHENVYAGNHIDHQHKKNLYSVIVGEKGVKLARRINNLDREIREANQSISDYKKSIQKIKPHNLSFDDFLNLKELSNVDELINDKESKLAAISKTDEILNKSILQDISIQEFPTAFQEVISKNIEEIAQDVEEMVKKHLEHHTNGAPNEWITSGLQYFKEDVCPFCAQSTEKAQIISAYKAYFSQSYVKLKSEIDSLKNLIINNFGDSNLQKISHDVTNNALLYDYWKAYIKSDQPTLDTSYIVKELKSISDIIQEYISVKQASPLEKINLGNDFWDAQNNFNTIKEKIVIYNACISKLNKLIFAKKNEIKIANPTSIENEISKLKGNKLRFEQDAKQSCKIYYDAICAKRQIEKEKNEVKQKLDDYTNNVFTNYEDDINKLLKNFGADFSITETKRSYIGGSASSHYRIRINDVSIDLGDTLSPCDIPSFKNTLSMGDKNALAFAFFVAKLTIDPNLSEKIIILDDPFSSLDESRRACTKQLICRLAKKAKQTIILSHNPYFLKTIWDNSDENKSLKIFKSGQNSIIKEWDIGRDTMMEYHKKHLVLTDYCDFGKGNKLEVAGTIRLLLEEYLRFKYPQQFLDNEWLGDFIKKIREARCDSPLVPIKSRVGELDDINEYSKQYHHATNPSYKTTHVNETELGSYSKRALQLVKDI